MHSNPLISVIVPIYKVEEYLQTCIDSIIKQTYPNLEIILVDDGSPDRCGDICDEYAKNDDRIVVIHKPNGGLSDARNAGLDICKGDYIAFVDSDDVISEKFIEVLYQNIGNADLAFCDLFYFDDGEIFTDQVKNDTPSVKLLDGQYLLGHINTFTDKGPLVVVAWNKLYRKFIWQNLRYPIGRIHEDEFVIHYILDICNKVSFIDLPLYFYRQRENSIMVTSSLKSCLDAIDAFKEREYFFKKKKMFDEAKSVYNLRYSLFLRENLSKQLLEQKILNILFDRNLFFKLKLKLVAKKIFPSFYKYLKCIRQQQ
ncbi:glycosyltransferase [Empedobacter falsenii]